MARRSPSRRTDTEWIGGIVTMPAYVTGEGEPFRPEALLWIGAEGTILGMCMGKPGEVLPQASQSLQEAMEAPRAGRPHRPDRVRVASPELAEALRDGQPDLEVVCAPTPEFDAISAQMREDMGEGGAPSSFAVGASPEAIASFFRAAAAMYRASPWEVVPSDQCLFSVTIEALDIRDTVLSVIGQAGERFGALLFASLEDFDAFCEMASDGAGPTPAVPPHIVLSFERGADLAPALRKEIAAHHWEVAGPGAYPSLVVVEEQLLVRPPTGKELAIAEAIARALPEVLPDVEQLLGAWHAREPYSRILQVATHRGEVDVTLTAPYVPASGSVLDRLAALLQDDDDGIDFDARKALEGELLRRFGASPEAKGLADGAAWSPLVMDFAADYFGGTIATLGASELRKIVFEFFPRKVSVEAAAARAVVEELRALYAFLKREFDLPQADACIRVLGGDAVKRLERELSDPSNFGMAKSVVSLGAEGGFDMGSKEGIEAFMQSMVGKRLPPSIPIPGVDPPRPSTARADKARKEKRKAARKARKKNR